MKARMTATIAIAVVAMMVFAAAGATTFSWFTDTEETDITITTGSLDVETSDFKVSVDDQLMSSSEGSSILEKISIEYDGGRDASNGWWTDSKEGKITIAGNPEEANIVIEYTVEFTSDVDYRYLINVSCPGLTYTVDVKDEAGNAAEWGEWVVLDQWSDGTTLSKKYDVAIAIDILPENFNGEMKIINMITQYQNVTLWDGSVPESKPDSLRIDTTKHLISINDVPAFAYLNEFINDADFVNKYGSVWRYSIELNTDVDLGGIAWTPIVMKNFVEFDGNDHTIYNLNAKGENGVGLFGVVSCNDTGITTVRDLNICNAVVVGNKSVGALIGSNPNGAVENVVVDNATITGVKYVGGIFGSGNGSVNNSTVKNSTITIDKVVYDSEDGSIDSKEAGGLAGYISNDGKAITENKIIAKNTVENVKIRAPSIASGLVSQPNSSNVGGALIEIKNNTLRNVTVLTTKDASAGLFVSNNVNGKSIVKDNNAENCKAGMEVYGLILTPDNNNSGTIFVNDKDGLLNLSNLNKDWAELFSNGKGTDYSNYATINGGLGTDFYYNWVWKIVLEADIDLEGVTIAPIELGKRSVFDGQNHVIMNASIETDCGTVNEAGLFIASDCGMENLKLDNIHVVGSNIGNSTAGVLSGSCNKAVDNITIVNSSVTNGKYTGGVIGYGYTSVTNCVLKEVVVKGGYKCGGVIGYICADNSKVSDVTGNELTNCTVYGIGDEYADGKNKYVLGKVVGNYNCDGTCNNNTIEDMITSATGNIGEIESGKNVTQ